ncbi:AzlC family ABC transporter permease [Petropleomorpha daqingensis]|uniref:Putative branched-subunit amino acid permease n=1 Tax=Petropleomorpha daqingensis TaxID=2026353 RepID=A0A853CR07_9ACTN|nr:AzlC family ABC transporter permease [Petropleomorpha daqingensis]NYJ08353.1 putative branched-subunit amino acid permease [Petropleomorpha daqingensis]
MTSTTARPAAPTRAGADWRAGVRAATPFVIGLAPFGVTVGAAVAASADPFAAWTGSFLLYGGSAQLAVLQVLGTDGPVWTAILVGILIQARLLVYSGGMAPLWKGARPWATALGAATIVEPTWAMAEHRLRTAGPDGARAHYAGAAAMLTVGWIGAITVGALVGRVPGLATHLAVAVPLCLVVMVAPHLRVPGGIAAVAAAVGTAVVARSVVPGFELLPAMAAAAAAGLLAERRRP